MTSFLRRTILMLLTAALLGGCVTFEVAPVTTMGCDIALAGHWLPSDAAAGDKPLVATDDCVAYDHSKPGKTEEMRFATFEFGGYNYLAFEADDIRRITDKDGNTVEVWPKTRVELYRYRLDGDQLRLWAADVETAQSLGGSGVVMHTDGAIDPKTTLQTTRKIQNNVYLSGTREDIGALLRTHGDSLYLDMAPSKAIVLQRVNTESTP